MPVTGEIFAANGGIFHRFGLAATDPVVIGGTPTVEDVVERWDEIRGPRLPRELDQEALIWGSTNYAEAFTAAVTPRSNSRYSDRMAWPAVT